MITNKLVSKEKEEVIEFLEGWMSSSKLSSTRNTNALIPSSVVSPIIDAALLAEQSNDVVKALEFIGKLKDLKSINLPKGAIRDMHMVIDVLRRDPDIKKLSYPQFIFFLYWLQKVISSRKS